MDDCRVLSGINHVQRNCLRWCNAPAIYGRPPRPPRVPKFAPLMDEAETDVLAYLGLPAQHRTKIRYTNAIERLNGVIKRRSDQQSASIARLSPRIE